MCLQRGLSEKAKNSTLDLWLFVTFFCFKQPLTGKELFKALHKSCYFFWQIPLFLCRLSKTNLWIACPVVTGTSNPRHHSILWTPLKDEKLMGSPHKYYFIKSYIPWTEELCLVVWVCILLFHFGLLKKWDVFKNCKYPPSHLLVYFAIFVLKCMQFWGVEGSQNISHL